MTKIFLRLILVISVFIAGCSGDNDVLENVNPDKVIEIKDAELEKIIRDKIGKEEGDILAIDMEDIYSMNINYKETPVKSISGLEYAVKLNDFSYRYGEGLESLNPISNIQTLEYLNISYSNIDGESKKFNTPALDRVSFIETNVSSYEFLEDCENITDLYISRSGLVDLKFLKNMSLLESLSLPENKISDITPLKDKTNLTSLSLHMNEVVDISVLETCINLENINISYNHVNNIEYLIGLKNLIELTAYEELDQKIIPRDQINTLIESGVSVLYHQ